MVLERLNKRGAGGIVGVNIGANKTSDDREGDYVHGVRAFHEVADYLTVNISSPNTPGLRGMQSRKELGSLLDRLNETRQALAGQTPMLLKIAPDLIDDELADICDICMTGAVDGLIISNTTLSRDGLRSKERDQAGGLSGAPLFERSTQVLAKACKLTNGNLPLIGVGGIASARQALDKITAGACLVQLYSAMVYQGPQLANDINNDLVKLMEKHNFSTIANAVGSNVDAWI
ncbi:MAG TPA: dihydroorotate dehydrogenase (quinone) [Rhizobiales bacterium]|nr:dihydroorotate dehydrogenase (quinone) [Hyphomicrobiales bacterium]